MARLNDEEFVAFLEKYRHEFHRYALRMVWNPATAEDVLASAVASAYQELRRFEPGSNFRAWLYKIITNKCYVANRETRRAGLDLDEIDESQMAVEADTLGRAWEDSNWFFEQCGDEVYQALRQLKTAERACLLLLSVEKYSYKEIAGILEMPVGTVMTHLARGRAKLRKQLAVYARERGIIGRQKNLAESRPLQTEKDEVR